MSNEHIQNLIKFAEFDGWTSVGPVECAGGMRVMGSPPTGDQIPRDIPDYFNDYNAIVPLLAKLGQIHNMLPCQKLAEAVLRSMPSNRDAKQAFDLESDLINDPLPPRTCDIDDGECQSCQ